MKSLTARANHILDHPLARRAVARVKWLTARIAYKLNYRLAIMAGARHIEIHGYRFIARPRARRRCMVRDFYPYWQSDIPIFTVAVKRTGPPSLPQRLLWELRFSESNRTGHVVTIPQLQTGEPHEFRAGERLLGFTGDTLLIIPAGSRLDAFDDPDKPVYHTLYAFHTTPKTWIFLTLAVSLITATLATMGYFLLNHFTGDPPN